MSSCTLHCRDQHITIALPDRADIRTGGDTVPLNNPAKTVSDSLENPIASVPLVQKARGKRTAVVVVSDYTRPVPYRDPDGILMPILNTLQQAGVQQITILIACGTHHPMSDEAITAMLGDMGSMPGVTVLNHIADDPDMLRDIGSTARTAHVTVNRHYLDADLKILTGLVEPHFMAGYSGGRKAICPGISGQDVTWGFHSASILADPASASLSMEQNPCHHEALTIANMAGADFIVNVTVDSDKHLTGVFSGDLEAAHDAAVEFLSRTAVVDIAHPYDLVITHAGDVGVNHYQCAKTAVEAARAATVGGRIIVWANLTDSDPVGSMRYRGVLKRLMDSDPATFLSEIQSAGWQFTPEQWQVQKLADVLVHLRGKDRLFTCAASLSEQVIPENNPAGRISPRTDEDNTAYARRLVQTTLDEVLARHNPQSILVLPDGPYAVPCLTV